MMEEKFRVELLGILGRCMEKEQIREVDMALTVLFQRYDVSERCTELALMNEQSNDKILNTYIASMRLEGHSEHTLEQYSDAVRKLLQDIPKDFSEIRTNDVRYHLARYQSTHKVSAVTVDNKRRFLSTFFAWLTAEEIIPKNPMLRIKRIKQKQTDKKPFSAAEMEKIRDSLQTVKEKALVEFLLSTGCRVSEVANLQIGNIDFRAGECVVLGKGNKERVIYLNVACQSAIEDWLTVRSTSGAADPYALFITRKHTRVTKDGVHYMIKKRLTAAGLDSSKYSAHKLRHTAATLMLQNGVDVRTLQEILGHEHLNTTQIYTHVSSDSLKSAADANPLNAVKHRGRPKKKQD